jgi:hypothetical protein
MVHNQGDSERWTQFQIAIFPELYVAFEFCKVYLKEGVVKFRILPLEHSAPRQL